MRHRLFIVPVLAASVASAQESPEATALRVAEAYNTGRAMVGPSAIELRAKDNIEIDSLGQGHVRFQQFLGGIPVFEAETVVHVDLGAQAVVDETDATVPVGAVDLAPRINSNHAREIALERFRVGNQLGSTQTLAVYMVGARPQLAWRVRVEGSQGGEAVDRIAFVDALSGGVLRAWDNLQTTAPIGAGSGFLGGQVALTTDLTATTFDSLDVAGHEMSRGVMSRTSNLTYSGESGGLNEATSDIFGTRVESYAANPADPADSLNGERPYKSGVRALRSMIRPSADGASADCWYSSVRNLDVHYSSGVARHFFHLLAEGTAQGSKTCLTGNMRTASGTGTIVGIGRSDAERIWYRALTVYMTPSTNYAGARVATLKAATDLFGAASTQYARVAAAWTAVLVR